MSDSRSHSTAAAREMSDLDPGSGRASRRPDAFSAEPLPDKIGNMLRRTYQDVVDEGIPDDFLDLLRQADTYQTNPGEAK